jgi:putative tryptophan/tyrosine transport system substrate-binding protein
MQRREFMKVVGCLAASWPSVTAAQQGPIPTVGFLSPRSPEESERVASAFRRGLAASGWIDGKNVKVDYRWAAGDYERLPALAKDLVDRRAAVLVTVGGEPAVLAAKAATTSIPIVAVFTTDPVEQGLVARLSHPGGNITGVSALNATLEAKRLGLLHDLLPKAETLGVLINPRFPGAANQLRSLEEAARTVRIRLENFSAGTDDEIESAFETISTKRISALVVTVDTFFVTRRHSLVQLAARYSLPAMYSLRDFAVTGGLISYGVDLPEMYAQVGTYAGQILRGAKPSELPVVQPTKFEMVINLKTAKTLGISVPPIVLATADEVIE